MSGFLNSLIPTIILLGGLIFIHELGHFWAAKLVDIEVKRFSIGLGPVIWSRTWGETEYALSAIPLGGYVKMGGMADEVMDRVEGGSEPPGGDGDDPPDGVEAEPAVPREPGPRDFDGKPLWARAFVISAGVAMNFIFAFVAYVAIAGLWGVGYPATSRVGVVSAELLPWIAGCCGPTLVFSRPCRTRVFVNTNGRSSTSSSTWLTATATLGTAFNLMISRSSTRITCPGRSRGSCPPASRSSRSWSQRSKRSSLM